VVTVPLAGHLLVANDPARPRSRLRSAGLLFVVWSIPALCHTGVEVLGNKRTGQSETIWQLLGASALPWYVWASATPLVKRAVRRFPLRRPEDAVGIAVHAALSIALTVVFVIVMRGLRELVSLPVPDDPVWQVAAGWSPFTLLAYAAIAASAHAELYATRADAEALHRAVLAEQLARAQLNALRMQLHPHFLFNALNTIAMLVRDQDSATAVRLIAELGIILRELLRDAGTLEVTLREELDLIGRYLGIEQVRFGARLTIGWQVDERALDAAVPPLILQPLVENAVRHGVAHCTKAGAICIGAAVAGDRLLLTVRDDGPLDPFAATCADQRRAPGAGVGLANTRERLARMYGDRATMRMERVEARHTLATVELPLTHARAHPDDRVAADAESAGAELWFAREPTRQDWWAPR
jgi:two-component system, LytTR family, sensor kinase